MTTVTVVGAGGWGSALAALLADQGQQACLWGRDAALVEEIRETRVNAPYLPGVELPTALRLESDLGKAVGEAEALVLAVPAQAMRAMLTTVKPLLVGRPLLISCAKGVEQKTHLRMTQVIEEVIGPDGHGGVVALSGPNHAEEVGRRIPSATVVASTDSAAGLRAQALFMAPYFRVYTNADVVGVEVAGALKNVIALASGISDGLGFGDNTKAALMTRGMAEMARLGRALGGKPLTFAGLAGMGDLIATCTSPHSRNRRAGALLGQGQSLKEVLSTTRMVVEGVFTTSAALDLAAACGVELPIAQVVDGVLFHERDPRLGVAALMERDPTAEDASYA